MSISANELKFLRSLQIKKFRQKYGQYLVEGLKTVNEFVNENSSVLKIYTSLPEYHCKNKAIEVVFITEKDAEKLTSFKTNPGIFALIQMQELEIPSLKEIQNYYQLALDNIRDPGNLGTLIRTADWYGLKHIFCSLECADIYNPKTIASSMGSLARVKVHYVSLEEFLPTTEMNVFGCFMDGDSIYKISNTENCIILIGNESNGIGKSLLPFVTQKVSIPNKGKAESLNASIAAAIVMDRLIGG